MDYGKKEKKKKEHANNQFICASEPLYHQQFGGIHGWQLVPANNMLIYEAGSTKFKIVPLDLNTHKNKIEKETPKVEKTNKNEKEEELGKTKDKVKKEG